MSCSAKEDNSAKIRSVRELLQRRRYACECSNVDLSIALPVIVIGKEGLGVFRSVIFVYGEGSEGTCGRRALDELSVKVVVIVLVVVTSAGRLDPGMSDLVEAGEVLREGGGGVMYDQSVNSVSRG